MKTFFLAGLLLALLPQAAIAQTTTQTSGDPTAPASAAVDLQTLADAATFRATLVATVVNGTATADDALVQLKAQSSPTGEKLDADADLGFASVDMGHRLLAAKRPDAALKFFTQAERSLVRPT